MLLNVLEVNPIPSKPILEKSVGLENVTNEAGLDGLVLFRRMYEVGPVTWIVGRFAALFEIVKPGRPEPAFT